MDDVYFPVCSPRLAGGRLPARPADLAHHTLLRSEREFWQPWFAAAGLDWPEPTRGPMFNDASHMLQAAIEGQGVALARSSPIGNDLTNGVLVRPFQITVPSPHKYFLVYPPRLANSPKLAVFRQWLLDEIATEQRGATRAGNRKAAPRGSAAASGARTRRERS
jgi:LysR family transcriptional regulator, glycine cleavage system transcriptional activator